MKFTLYIVGTFLSSLPVANTLTGTTGNDILNAPGSVATDVLGLQGDDSITLNLAGDNGYGAAGADSFNINVGTHSGSVYGGDGNDTLAFSTANTIFGGRAVLGGGADVVSSTGTQVTGVIGGNAGSDTISIAGGGLNGRINGGADADLVSVTAGTMTNTTIHGGKGKDTLTLNGSTITSGTVSGNAGSDVINGSGATFTTSFAGLGKGNDSIALGAVTTLTVAGGAGADTIGNNTGTIFQGGTIYGDKNGVTTSTTSDITGANAANPNGADLIGHTGMTIASGAALSIYGAGGSDTIRFSSGSTGASVFIAGGDGSDLLGSTAATLGFSASTIQGGAGADTITLGAMFTGATGVGNLVLGGAGADSITLVTAAGSYNGSINGGAGNDTINLLSGLVGGAKGATLTTINGGEGTDVIQFSVASGGIQTLTSLTAGNVTGQTAYHAAIVYEAGDIIKYANTAISTTGANWVGGGGQILVVTSITAVTISAAANGANYSAQSAGSITVFSDGTDTYFFLASQSRSATFNFVVTGKDLVATTAVGLVNNTSTNVLFSAAANTGTSGNAAATGVAITLL